jgi:predicted Rdx family selenoprotein
VTGGKVNVGARALERVRMVACAGGRGYFEARQRAMARVPDRGAVGGRRQPLVLYDRARDRASWARDLKHRRGVRNACSGAFAEHSVRPSFCARAWGAGAGRQP